MKKLVSLLLGLLLVASVFSGCSNSSNNEEPSIKSPEPSEVTDDNQTANTSKILIVYYSLTRTTENVAKAIQEKTSADIYMLTPETPYLLNHDEAINEMNEERDSGHIRELLGTLPDVSEYDVVLIGGPVWSGKPSNPIQKYLSITDFGGVKVAGFWTAGSNPANYAADFEAMINNAVVLEGLSLVGSDLSNRTTLDSKIDTWLSTLILNQVSSNKSDNTALYAVEPKTVRVAQLGKPTGVFVPTLSDNEFDREIDNLIYEPLLQYLENHTFGPYLALSYNISNDGKTFTFYLRNDVTWQDGEKLTAEDFKFTLEFIGHQDYNGVHRQIADHISGIADYRAGRTSEITGVTLTDNQTISIKFNEVYDKLLYDLGYDFKILPKHIWENVKISNVSSQTELLNHPVGTGPYKVEEFKSGVHTTLTAYENYWHAHENVDKFIFIVTNNEEIKTQMLNGGFDFVYLADATKDSLTDYINAGMKTIEISSAGYGISSSRLTGVSSQSYNVFFRVFNWKTE